jgi:hypothetical protein
MTNLAVYDTPHLPEEWHGRNVVRIVDALGKSIAWTDPALAGSCVGFCARSGAGSPWFIILESQPPWALDDPGALGCDVLWTDSTYSPMPARCLAASWSFVDRDPTQVRVAGKIGDEEIEITSRCEDGTLALAITRVRGHSKQIRAGFRLQLRNVSRDGLAYLRREPNEVSLSSPQFPFKTLVCRSPLTMETRPEPADGMMSAASIDFVNLDEPLLDGEPEMLAELELVPQFRD